MGSHADYGKEMMRLAAGNTFVDRGSSVEVDYGAGHPARIDGTVSGNIAVEIDSRVAKQVRGAVLDLLCHRYPKKLLVLIPVHMSDCDVCASQCRSALGRFVKEENFRVVILRGSRGSPVVDFDVQTIRAALYELGYGITP